jgi:hypothetical protein
MSGDGIGVESSVLGLDEINEFRPADEDRLAAPIEPEAVSIELAKSVRSQIDASL